MEKAPKDICLRCSKKMEKWGSERLRFANKNWFFGHNSIFVPSMEIDVFICTSCGKVEFFLTGKSAHEFNMKHEYDAFDFDAELPEEAAPFDSPSKTCPRCFFIHDVYEEICPNCNYNY